MRVAEKSDSVYRNLRLLQPRPKECVAFSHLIWTLLFISLRKYVVAVIRQAAEKLLEKSLLVFPPVEAPEAAGASSFSRHPSAVVWGAPRAYLSPLGHLAAPGPWCGARRLMNRFPRAHVAPWMWWCFLL